MDLPSALDVGNRAVDRGAMDGRVMPDGDRVVALKHLEPLEDDDPVIEVIHDGESVFVRRKYQVKRHQHFLLGQQSGELQIRFSVDEPPKVIGDAVDPLHTFGDYLRRGGDLSRNPVTIYRAEAIESGLASSVELVGDPVQSEHASVGETLGQNLKTGPVIGMRMRENDPIDRLAERLHV